MTDKDVLELQNMFTTAAQLAKSRNIYTYKLEMNETTLIELLQKAFPSLQDSSKISLWAKKILEQ